MNPTRSVARPIRAVAAAGVLLAGLLLASAPVSADGGGAMNVDVTSSVMNYDETGTICTWWVSSDVIIVNLTNSVLTYSAVTASVSWVNAANGTSGVVTPTVIDNGGLVVGGTLGAGFPTSQNYSPFQVEVILPCDVTDADLAVEITTAYGSGSGDAPFVDGGVNTPEVTVAGAFVATALAGVILIRRRRTPAVVAGA